MFKWDCWGIGTTADYGVTRHGDGASNAGRFSYGDGHEYGDALGDNDIKELNDKGVETAGLMMYCSLFGTTRSFDGHLINMFLRSL